MTDLDEQRTVGRLGAGVADVARHADRRRATPSRRTRSGPGWSGSSHEQPFLLAGRYAPDRAEVRYWEEAPDVASSDAAALALRLWGEHRGTAGAARLAASSGSRCVDRETFQLRGSSAAAAP